MTTEAFIDAVGWQHPRDAWYMAGWDKDVPPGEITAITMLGQPLALARDEAGTVFALEDRCPHRAAPLSLGRCEGGGLRCLYHGIRFASDGRAVEVPGQDVIPPALRARAYPVVERHAAIWVWMGDPALADAGQIPEFIGYRHPDWAMTPGRLDYEAPARLIHDNLLDLSHIAYVHAATFAGGSEESADGWLAAKISNITLPNGVAVERAMAGMPPNPAGGRHVDEADVWSRYDFTVPGVFILRTETYPHGTMDRASQGRCEGLSQFTTFTCQAVTPLTADTTCYFFAFGPWAAEAEKQDFFADLGLRAFHEDKRMIEAQWRTMQATGTRIMPLAMDQAVLKYEAVNKRLLAARKAAMQEKETA
ncbi:aromatic ring-hydroxylating dioxygenase subunit alpha [Alteraurantiacibacter aestuarii]|uniref:Rieske 2Fe-2S domain-containing protein n=1 Tax=Alteraurantiacibacter aestuarii TaxID=650004 RepID=A0A844ZN90_9SPHN|nr:aromatic ring-hydroxylating dioxygenase subunit alpha [Alteraurantiacibacter aestuarii]MXO88782.1 Rieske 2Fe-2S domain-containing protein [Alteraurantiacibacter aestuarii]